MCLTATFSLQHAAKAQYSSQRGAAVGGVAGAIAGGVIGENNDEPLAGAVIGGALGVVTGAIIGDSKDRDIAAARQYEMAQSQAYAQARAQAVTFESVIQMTRAGLSDSVISNEIQRRGVSRRPNVSEIIMLHNNGVSDVVISSLQSASGPTVVSSSTVVVPAQPATVHVVPTTVIHPHVRYVAPRHYHYRPRRPARSRTRVGFSFGF